MRIQELPFYFEGPALQLVDYCILSDDPAAGFADAISALDRKFLKVGQSALEMFADLLVGNNVTAKNTNALLSLYSQLHSRYRIAVLGGMASEFENDMVVKAILAKTPFLSPEWVEKRVKAKKVGRRLSFPDFLAFLNERHDYHVEYNSIISHVSSNPGQEAPEVVELMEASPAEQVVDALLAPICVVCGGQHHLVTCPAASTMDADSLKKRLYDAKACFRCGSVEHLAIGCDADARCMSCSRPHMTVLCSIQAPPRGYGEGGSGS